MARSSRRPRSSRCPPSRCRSRRQPSTASSASRAASSTRRKSSPAARATASTSTSRRRARPSCCAALTSTATSRGSTTPRRAPSRACAPWSSCRARSRASRSRPTSRPASRSSPTTRGPRSRAANALKVEWTRGPFASESSAALDAQCAELLAKTGQVVRNDGDFDAAARAAAKVVKARYRIPFVSHAPLEAPCAFVHVQADRARVVAALQQPGGASRAVQHGDRHPARRDQRRDDSRGRRLRPAPHQRLRGRGGARLEGDRLAGQARVDALGRPAARLLPAVRPPRAGGGARRGRAASPAGRIASRARRSTTGARA